MVTSRRMLTAAEFEAIDTPGRYDLVDGELWSLPPNPISSGRSATRLIVALGLHLDGRGNGEILSGDVGFVLGSDGRTILCPDVAFVCAERVPSEEETGFFNGAPDLAIEVISDPERPQQVQTKVARYLSAGATLVWCVYPSLQRVVVYHQNYPPRILGIPDTLTADLVVPGFELPLDELFGPG